MRRIKDRILQRIIEKIKLSYQNDCKSITIDELESQYRDMPEMQNLTKDERYELIKSKLYPARKRSQKLGIPIRRLWAGGTGFKKYIFGLKPVDINSKEDCAMLEGDLEIDRKKKVGIDLALDERARVALEAKALTGKQVKRFQLIGGKGKKEKILKK